MNVKEFYDSIGGDYSVALTRLMRDSLIEKFVLKFLNDKTFESLKEAADAGRWDDAFAPAHTLKGVALNLAFAELGASANTLTDALRPQNAAMRDPAALEGMYRKVCEDYETVIAQINVFQASKQ